MNALNFVKKTKSNDNLQFSILHNKKFKYILGWSFKQNQLLAKQESYKSYS